MLYILGGAARAGKSTFAHRLVTEKGISYFSTDCLISILEKAAPQIGIKHGQPFLGKAQALWPFVEALLTYGADIEQNYLIEGDGFTPADIAQFIKDKPYCKAAFVGFCEITPEVKLRQIRTFKTHADWTNERDDKQMILAIQGMIEFSRFLRDECVRYEVKYFDCSNNFDETQKEMFTYFVS